MSSKYALANKNEKKSATYLITDDAVAYLNTRTWLHSGGIIYAGSDEFLISDELMSIKKVRVSKNKVFIEK